MRRTISLLASVLLLLLALVPGRAMGSLPCSGGVSNYFDGVHSRSGYAAWSAKATIQPNVGAICTGGSTGASAAWAMMADNYFSGNGGYAQSGYARITGVASRYFSQYRRSSAYAPTTVWGGSATATKVYATIYGDTTLHLNMWVGSSLFSSTNFNPDTVWVKPFNAQYFGETWKPADDMPGTAGDHTDFTVLRYSPTKTLQWQLLPSGYQVITGSSRYKWAGALNDFDIWTSPLQ